jgi:hypothetical protein
MKIINLATNNEISQQSNISFIICELKNISSIIFTFITIINHTHCGGKATSKVKKMYSSIMPAKEKNASKRAKKKLHTPL